jgi:hypothetical protein
MTDAENGPKLSAYRDISQTYVADSIDLAPADGVQDFTIAAFAQTRPMSPLFVAALRRGGVK